ncbi:MAG: hypothetical protein NTY38_20115 [Acidobacteria bacterium]|nr:hypothetical protein [Acidobacteriota bacterium]
MPNGKRGLWPAAAKPSPHWTAILQWSTVILLLIVILATLTRIVSNSEP